jgi:phosphatidylglycerophosphate synthase
MPKKLSPNVLTLTGLLPMLCLYVYTTIFTSPDFSSAAMPWWTHLLAGLFLLLFLITDSLDGIHARAIASCSPLGDVLDHCGDSVLFFCTTALAMCMLPNVDANTYPVAAFLSPLACIALSAFVQWETLMTGTLSLPAVNGAEEGMFVIALIFIVTAVWPGLWELSLFGLHVDWIFIFLTAVFPLISCVLCVLNVHKALRLAVSDPAALVQLLGPCACLQFPSPASATASASAHDGHMAETKASKDAEVKAAAPTRELLSPRSAYTTAAMLLLPTACGVFFAVEHADLFQASVTVDAVPPHAALLLAGAASLHTTSLLVFRRLLGTRDAPRRIWALSLVVFAAPVLAALVPFLFEVQLARDVIVGLSIAGGSCYAAWLLLSIVAVCRACGISFFSVPAMKPRELTTMV